MFRDRQDAGVQLARRIAALRLTDPVVLGLPRGGVPVAAEVARVLGAPLDVLLVRKLGSPANPEFAVGAIGEDGVRVIADAVVARQGIDAAQLAGIEARERVELERRAERYRQGRPRLDLRGKTAVIVDDGIATGATALAACTIARNLGAARIVLAVPVAPADWRDTFAGSADDLVVLETPQAFLAVGQAYADFGQTSDAEVLAALGVT